MSAHWPEGYLSFAFDDTWHAVKWDGHDAHQNGIQKVHGFKAVDFCGVRARALFLIEVKDFRGHRIENKPRLDPESPESLADEVAKKACSTIAGLVCARRTRTSEEDLWRPFGDGLADPRAALWVILWLEEDLQAKASLRMVVADKLRQKLKWLTPKIAVVDARSSSYLPGLTVTNRQGAGQGGAS